MKEKMTYRERLRRIVEDNSTRKGRIFDSVIQIFIFASLFSFTIETTPDLSPDFIYGLNIFETVSIVLFTLEYLLRIYVAKKPLKYIFSFYGIIDFLAIFPFYLRTVYDFRALRAFRVFRVFKSLKLPRFNRALRRFHIAFKIVKEEFVLFLMASAILIFLSASGIYYFEHDAQPDAFGSVIESGWWAVVTLTTVGYGDVYPITVGGRIFTVFILLIGVGIVTIPAGLVASALSKAREVEQENKHHNA